MQRKWIKTRVQKKDARKDDRKPSGFGTEKKKKHWGIVAGAMAVVLAGGSAGYYFLRADASEAEEKVTYTETQVQYGDISLDVTGEGTTAISYDSELPSFSASAADLVVEEVYVASGDTVATGDALLKLTDDSVTAAKTYYEEQIAKAQSALDTAQNDYNVGILEAGYDQEQTNTEAESAASSYQAALSELDNAVTEAQTDLTNAQTQIAEYTDKLANNTYYTDNGVEAAQTAVTEAQAASDAAKNAYDTAKSEYQTASDTLQEDMNTMSLTVTGEEIEIDEGDTPDSTEESGDGSQGGTDGQSGDGSQGGEAPEGGSEPGTKQAAAETNADSTTDQQTTAGEEDTETEEDSEELTELSEMIVADYIAYRNAKTAYETARSTYETAETALEKAQSSYQQANSKYQQETEQATQQKEQLENQLDQLQSAYDQAVSDQTTQAASLKNTYDQAVLNGEYADTTYAATVKSLQDAVDSAQSTLDELTEEQTELAALENGVVCATQDGTIATVAYEAENVLLSDTVIVTYNDASKISISLEIDQADISKLAVGDTAQVAISNSRGTLNGTIASIATAATEGGSMSNVTYAVVVEVDNTDGYLSAGSSAVVTFNYGSLSDVYYVSTDAITNKSENTANVLQYNDAGEVENVSVTIGESTDTYTVITEGISEGDTCLIENETGGDK